MKYEADIQFGIIIGDKTTGIRDGKEEERYKVIGIMGLKLDGMELVPCSLKDYKFKIECTGDEIKIGTYLCTGINFVRYYGFWSKRKDCLDIFRSVLPVYLWLRYSTLISFLWISSQFRYENASIYYIL